MRAVLEATAWLADLLRAVPPAEGEEKTLQGIPFVTRDGIPRAKSVLSREQRQTKDVFAFKWQQRESFESAGMRDHMRAWLNERYGAVSEHAFLSLAAEPVVLDAGCGAGYSALEYFDRALDRIRYLGIDVSEAVDVAVERFAQRGFERAAFLQADICALPLRPASVDVVFSEGVLHHTDSTERALKYLATLLRPGGHFMFYVYRRKGPIREFTDDYVRAKLQALSPQEAWDAMMPLSRLGKLLGECDVHIDIPEEIGLLEIPAGKIPLQRFFYWHVLKAFYRAELTIEEMNHVNFDWYAPKNAHRQTVEDVRAWCAGAGLCVIREVVQEAGITIIARKDRAA